MDQVRNEHGIQTYDEYLDVLEAEEAAASAALAADQIRAGIKKAIPLLAKVLGRTAKFAKYEYMPMTNDDLGACLRRLKRLIDDVCMGATYDPRPAVDRCLDDLTALHESLC
jgi:hypothetical protein